jgi:hypothetical protein
MSGITGHAMHTHGGPAALVGSARFTAENHSSVARELRVASVDFLSDHGVGNCEGPATTFRKRLSPAGLRFDDDGGYDPHPALVLPAGATRMVEAYFEPAGAYYAYCDTFAFRVHVLVDGSEALVLTNLQVTRVDPRRPPSKEW